MIVETCSNVESEHDFRSSVIVEGYDRGEQVVDMLVDTGSVLSIVSSRLWEPIKILLRY